MPRMGKHSRLAAGLIAGALVVAAAAPAASTQRYSGKVKNAGTLAFRVSGAKVKRFQASMNASCVSVAGARGKVEVYVLAPSGSAKVSRAGKFSFTVNLPKQQFKDKSGQVIATLYSVKGTVKGTLSGRSAAGTVKVTYNRYWLSGMTFVPAACTSGKTPLEWTARRG